MTVTAADFAEFARRMHAQDDVDETLENITRTAAEAVGADMCGVMLVHRGDRLETASVTDELVQQADDLQISLGIGPCLEAIEDGTNFLVTDTATDPRWEPWCRAVAGLGLRSVVSVRLHTQDTTFGSLNLYGREPAQFDSDHALIAAIFAGHASVALRAARTATGLREAMDGRHLIGLAQGILMERFDLSTEQSFAVLRRYSQDRNIKLRTVAAQVVETRALPE